MPPVDFAAAAAAAPVQVVAYADVPGPFLFFLV